MESDAKWEQLASLRDELDRRRTSSSRSASAALDGKPHELSPKARRFAEALAVSDGWTRITDARSRRLAA